MAVPAVRTEKAYEKHAWILLVPIVLIVFMFGLMFLVIGSPTLGEVQDLTGMTWNQIVSKNPGIANLITLRSRIEGLAEVTFGILGMAVAAIPYRKGERWAWFVSWLWPVFLIGDTALDAVAGEVGFLFVPIPFITLTVLGLVLPYRKFFPRKQA